MLSLCPDTALDKQIVLPLASVVVIGLLPQLPASRAHQVLRVENGSGLTPDHSHTRPADILALDWDRGRHAAFHVTVASPLSPFSLRQACQWGQQHLRQRCENTEPMIPSALSWDGFVSH